MCIYPYKSLVSAPTLTALFNRRTSQLTARRSIDQSTIVGPQRPGTPQRPAAMDAAPHGPYGRRADARPASVGRLSGLSGR